MRRCAGADTGGRRRRGGGRAHRREPELRVDLRLLREDVMHGLLVARRQRLYVPGVLPDLLDLDALALVDLEDAVKQVHALGRHALHGARQSARQRAHMHIDSQARGSQRWTLKSRVSGTLRAAMLAIAAQAHDRRLAHISIHAVPVPTSRKAVPMLLQHLLGARESVHGRVRSCNTCCLSVCVQTHVRTTSRQNGGRSRRPSGAGSRGREADRNKAERHQAAEPGTHGQTCGDRGTRLHDVAVALVFRPVDPDLLKVDLVEGALLVRRRRRRVLKRERAEEHHEEQHAARPHVCTQTPRTSTLRPAHPRRPLSHSIWHTHVHPPRTPRTPRPRTAAAHIQPAPRSQGTMAWVAWVAWVSVTCHSGA